MDIRFLSKDMVTGHGQSLFVKMVKDVHVLSTLVLWILMWLSRYIHSVSSEGELSVLPETV